MTGLTLQGGRVKGPPLQTLLVALHGAGTGVMSLDACKPSIAEDEAQALLKVWVQSGPHSEPQVPAWANNLNPV